MSIIPLQLEFCPEVRTVEGNVDYTRFAQELSRIDEIIRQSGIEDDFVRRSVEKFKADCAKRKTKIKNGHIRRHEQRAITAFRSMILQGLLSEDFRGMSRRLAECPLFRWFCQIERLDIIRVPSKSTLQEFSQMMPEDELREIIGKLVGAGQEGRTTLNLANDLELNRIWLDTTAVKTNIHFPVDWVLLRDAVRTLMKATILIRSHGLKSRMESPKKFLKEMNRLSIEMTQCRRKSEAKRQRKKTLRKMKKMVKVVLGHARRHRDLLDSEWEQTDWTRKQAEQVIRRLDGVIELLPQAQKQAHERIIGERQVKSSEKLLSIYETETRVIVRGKAEADVEFGNTLLLAEQENGVIVDWELYRESAPADSQLLQRSITRIESTIKKTIESATTDRGFDSADNVTFLEKKKIYNGMCPRNPHDLKKRRRQRRFVLLQTRRGSTEARVGILKNSFLGTPMRAKGFEHRELTISWRVLAHNLWVLARLPMAELEEPLRQAA